MIKEILSKDGNYLSFRYDDGIRIYSANKAGSAVTRLTSGEKFFQKVIIVVK